MKRKILSVLIIYGMLFSACPSLVFAMDTPAEAANMPVCAIDTPADAADLQVYEIDAPAEAAGTETNTIDDPMETTGTQSFTIEIPAADVYDPGAEEAAGSGADNDELLLLYMDEVLNNALDLPAGQPETSPYSAVPDAGTADSKADLQYAGQDLYSQGAVRNMKKNLSSGSAKVFDALKARIVKVANGQLTSTEFKLSFQNDLAMTASADGATEEKAVQAAYASMNLNLQAVIHALLADCPYDLYWYDKGVSLSCSYSYTYRKNKNGTYNVTLNEITFKFPVAADYAGSSDYTVNKSKMTAVQTALNTISSIISEYRGLSDVEKLRAYKNRICALTAYNKEAAETGASSHYVNPWQLIWVFDNDPSTKVVCEGYSKAFQYLCDRSSFNGPVYCISVSGTMSDSVVRGAHMWNIVHMDDGLNYLVDVTGCDNEEIGADDLLFMVKPSSGSVSTKYHFHQGYFDYDYWYDSNTRLVYSEQDLMLSRSTFRDVQENDYFLEPVLWAVQKKITDGTSATTFSPAAACTRAQAVTFLWRAYGSEKVSGAENPFIDINESDYYYNAVLWALQNGITKGMTEAEFGPDGTCTRGQIVTLLWRAAGEPDSSAEVSFRDVSGDAYYYPAVRWAVEKSITKGTSEEEFSPDAFCTRGQIVTFLYRALK